MSTLSTPQVTQRILARTRATRLKLEPQVALVARAIAPDDRGAPLPLKSAKTVELLQATFREDRALAAHVEGVLRQFREATDTLAAVEAAVAAHAVTEAQVDALKRVALFLSKFHESVKQDPLLAQLFPAPEVLQAESEGQG